VSRWDDIDPQDIDPDTGRPYAGYSSPSLDTSFHDAEMDVDGEADALGDWQYEVYNGNTRLGFEDWRKHREDSDL
jgi:hypothetical protein